MDLKDIIRLADRLDAAGSYREAENLDAELVRLAASPGGGIKNFFQGLGKSISKKTNTWAEALGKGRAALPNSTAVEELLSSTAPTREMVNTVIDEIQDMDAREIRMMSNRIKAALGPGTKLGTNIADITEALEKIRGDASISQTVKDNLMTNYRLLMQRSMERAEGMKRLRNFGLGAGALGAGAIGYNMLTADEAVAAPAAATGTAATPAGMPGAAPAAGGAPVNPYYNELLTRIESGNANADLSLGNNPTGGSAGSIRGFEPTAAGIGKYFAGMYASALDRGVAPQKAMDHVTKEMGKFGVDADVYREFMRQRR